MRNLIWRPSALDQFDSLVGYIAERDKSAAEHLEHALLHATKMILVAPHAGRPSRVKGTREWIVLPNYLLVYRVNAKTITILRALHARQLYP